MKKVYVVISCLILTVNSIYSQYQAANWPLTYNNLVVKITNGTFERDSLPDGNTTGFIANSSISDNEGNLLLYSFGVDIRNKYGNVVDGGCCLCESVDMPSACVAGESGNPHSQGALILPRPNSNTQYYLFIKDMDTSYNDLPLRVTATLIDAHANNDSGVVISRAVPILQDVLGDARMTACQHGNGRDWWLINHQHGSNKIYTHLITPDSIYGAYQQNIGLSGSYPDGFGWSLFAPNTNTFATTTGGMDSIVLLDFDRCSGTFSNLRAFNTVNGDTGNYFEMAFSPNGRFLYASNNSYLEQFDLQSSDISASRKQLIHDTANFPLLGFLVLMPDGKIYISGYTVADSLLSVIDSPNLKFPDCDFHLRSLLVPNSILIQNVPNFPNYNLGPVIGSGCDTITDIRQQTQDIRQIQVQPNPADAYTEIKINVAGDYEAKLLNEVGQVLEVMQINATGSFNTTGLAQGLYFIQVVNNQNVSITRKVIVLH